MPNLATEAAKGLPVRVLGVGDPGNGKTGSLAALVNTGKYNVRVIDLDGNLVQSLTPFVDPKFAHKVEFVNFEEKGFRIVSDGSKANVATIGPPTVFTRTLAQLDKWVVDGPDGQPVDRGGIMTWTRDDVLVLDSLSALNRACIMHTEFLKERVTAGMRYEDWGTAAKMETALIERVTSPLVPCHVVVFAHTKLVGPPDPNAKDDEQTKEVKAAKIEHIPWEYVPSAVGRDMSKNVAQHFPVVMLYDREVLGPNVKRIVRFQPHETWGLKVPLKNLPKQMPAADALLWLFEQFRGAGTAAVATN